MNKIFLLLSISLLVLQSTFAQDSWETVKANGGGNVTVQYYVDKPYFFEEEGKLQGTEYKIFTAFMDFVQKRYSVKINVDYKPNKDFTAFYGSIKGGSTGTFGLGSVSITEERKSEVKFSRPYMPDIDVLISSNNLPVVTDSAKIPQLFKEAKGLAVAGTTYETEMKELRKRFPSLNIVLVERVDDIRTRIASEDNLYGFSPLANYLLMRQKGIRVKRQVLFKVKREGLAMIMPQGSDWDEPVQEFFNSSAYENILNDIYREYFGDEANEIVMNQGGNEDLLSIKEQEIREKELSQQENQINTTQGQLAERNRLLYVGLGLLVLIAVLLIVFLSRYRNQKKSNVLLEQLNKEVEAQKKQLQNANTDLKNLNDEVAEQRDKLSEAKDVLEEQNKQILDSINAGKSIQTALLPFENRMRESFSDYFVIWNPKDVVSGDFYWLSKIGDTTFVAAVDCTGHGVPGAFVSMLGYALLNDIVNVQRVHEPNKILEKLHDGIESALMQGGSDEKHGMDVCFCRIDKISDEEYQLIYAGAKRPLYVFQNGKLGKLAGDRQGVGGGLMTVMDKKMSFNNYGLSLKKGDVLYLTTDGYADAPNTERKKLGTSQMEEYFKQYAPFPMKWQQNKLLQNLNDHQDDIPARDDVTIIGIKL